KRLRASILPLADAGIDVQFRRLPGGVRVIDLFASQNPPPPPQPLPEQELTPTQEIPPPPGLCVTTPAAQSPHPPHSWGHGSLEGRSSESSPRAGHAGLGSVALQFPLLPPRATTKSSDTHRRAACR